VGGGGVGKLGDFGRVYARGVTVSDRLKKGRNYLAGRLGALGGSIKGKTEKVSKWCWPQLGARWGEDSGGGVRRGIGGFHRETLLVGKRLRGVEKDSSAGSKFRVARVVGLTMDGRPQIPVRRDKELRTRRQVVVRFSEKIL